MFHLGMNFWNRPFICTQRELRGSKLDAKTSRARSELTKYPPKPIIFNPSFLIIIFFGIIIIILIAILKILIIILKLMAWDLLQSTRLSKK